MRFLGSAGLYFSVISAAGIAGCSTSGQDAQNAKPESVHQEYVAKYTSDQHVTGALARFHLETRTGTTLQLSGKAGVTHNKHALVQGANLGVCYERRVQGRYLENTFEYTDINGKKYTNSISLPVIDFAPDTPVTITRDKPLRLAFTGKPLATGEYVNLDVTQEDKHVPISRSAAEVGATAVEIPVVDLQQLKVGDVQLCFTRVLEVALKEATPSGGVIAGVYESPTRTLRVVK